MEIYAQNHSQICFSCEHTVKKGIFGTIEGALFWCKVNVLCFIYTVKIVNIVTYLYHKFEGLMED